MKKIVALFLVAAIAAGLSACGSSKEVLKVFNDGSYIDKSVITDFEKEYNVKVVYDEYSTNEEMYAKVSTGSSGYDVVVPSDYMVDRMEQEGMLAQIDKTAITNFGQIAPEYLAPSYDPNNDYSIPYMVGTLGIIYNKTMVSAPPTSWSAMWDPQYKGEILMWDSMRDTMCAAQKLLGFSVNTEDDAQLAQVKQKLIEQKPLVQAYVGDETKDKMVGGEAAMALLYSGDAYAATLENPDLDYVIPDEGSNKWVDSWCVLKTSQHVDLAEKWIDFMCRPDVAVKNMNATGYTSAIEGAWSSFPDNHIMFPTQDELDRCEAYLYSKTAVDKYNNLWVQFRSQ